MAAHDYDLPKNQANFAALSPLSFLARSEAVRRKDRKPSVEPPATPQTAPA